MMSLPPGCSVGYEIRFMVPTLTDKICEWFNMIGGTATKKQFWDHRGREQFTLHVQYGKAKPSYRLANGEVHNIIRFDGADASAASMFLIKFMDQIQSHNLKEAEHYVY
jgi:hypothetical protein